MGDRRFAVRLPREDSVELLWHDQTGQEQRGEVWLADISASGASLRTVRPLRLGSNVILRYQNQELPSKVKYCVKRGSAFVAGIEFHAGYRWRLTAV